VTSRVKRRLQTSWHVLRQHLGANQDRLQRLVVEKAQWLHDASSPVMLSIDDLTNAWHQPHADLPPEHAGDWGGRMREPGSALEFLEDRLMRTFPELKVTFFAVAGPISAYTHHRPFSHAASLDATEESKRFFRAIAEDSRYELAYHGLNHGTAAERTEDFIQEWRGFNSVESAVAQTRRGLEIFVRATGREPNGGKYGGWEYNEFAEPALEQCKFAWWCRDWTPRDTTGRIPDEYYSPHFFGSRMIVGLPTTVHGRFWSRRQIDILLAKRQLIAVEEHIAPIRPDGLIQTPNIVDDLEDLRRLFSYLRGKNVWYATGSEIAEYIVARDRSVIYDVSTQGFSLNYEGRLNRPALSLRIDCRAICGPTKPLIEVILPDGVVLDPAACQFDIRHFRHLITIPAMDGPFRIRPISA
jgi:hypothetical protein